MERNYDVNLTWSISLRSTPTISIGFSIGNVELGLHPDVNQLVRLVLDHFNPLGVLADLNFDLNLFIGMFLSISGWMYKWPS